MVKFCNKCKHLKSFDSFYKDVSSKDGLQAACRECQKQYVLANKERIKEYQRNWLKANGKGAKRQANYRKRHGDKYRQDENLWARSKKGRAAEKSSKFRAQKANAEPKWLNKQQKQAIKNMYINCPVGHHVDHIVPLRGKNVCGLHVPWNLQYLSIKDNLKKSNKF